MGGRFSIWLSLVLAIYVTVALPILYVRIQNVQRHQNDALHSIICQAEHAVRAAHGISPQKREQALRFYERASARAHLKPCP